MARGNVERKATSIADRTASIARSMDTYVKAAPVVDIELLRMQQEMEVLVVETRKHGLQVALAVNVLGENGIDGYRFGRIYGELKGMCRQHIRRTG